MKTKKDLKEMLSVASTILLVVSCFCALIVGFSSAVGNWILFGFALFTGVFSFVFAILFVCLADDY